MFMFDVSLTVSSSRSEASGITEVVLCARGWRAEVTAVAAWAGTLATAASLPEPP